MIRAHLVIIKVKVGPLPHIIGMIHILESGPKVDLVVLPMLISVNLQIAFLKAAIPMKANGMKLQMNIKTAFI
jgi:hypothetical protein